MLSAEEEEEGEGGSGRHYSGEGGALMYMRAWLHLAASAVSLPIPPSLRRRLSRAPDERATEGDYA